MSLVSSFTEWDPLEEVIVGRVENARIPEPDLSLHAVEYGHLPSPEAIPSGPFDDRVVKETRDDLEALVEALVGLGVKVRRPDVVDHGRAFQAPGWRTNGFYNYCPRDLFFVTGRKIIEAPMSLRSRQHETLSYKRILLDYMRSGAEWISAPRPALEDSMYDLLAEDGRRLANAEPAFDAANTLRIGRDILYLVSNSGNEIGAEWLQNVLGTGYRVHRMRNLYAHTHVDSTITLLRPGLVLLNPERVNETNVPAVFGNWDKLWCPEMVDIGYTRQPYSSKWIGMNLLMINESLAAVERAQAPLIRELGRQGIDVVPLSLRHARTLGGGFHCVTIDVRREGSLQSYD